MKTNFLRNAILNHYLGVTPYTMPSSVTVALSSTEPNLSGGNLTEPQGVWYSRQQASFTNASNGSSSNTDTIDFGTVGSAANGFVVSHFALFSGSDMLAFGELTDSKTLNTGDTVSFPANQLIVNEN